MTKIEPTLTRKPRKGDRLETVANYENFVNGKAPAEWRAAGTVTRCEGNLCHYLTDSGRDTLFIWRSSDGLNGLVRLAEAGAA